MRILHANNVRRGSGGSTRSCEASIAALRRAGVEVDVFLRDSKDIGGGVAGKLGALLDGLHGAAVVRDFAARLRERRPDVVHVHELFPLIPPRILAACAEAGIPVVMTCYDYRLTCPVATHRVRGEACFRCLGGREHWCVLRNCRGSLPESIAHALHNAAARRAGHFERHVARFLPLSGHLRDFMVERQGIDPGRIAVSHPPIRLPLAPVADPAAGAYVAYAGRFVPEKGVEVMVEACRRLGLPMRFSGDAPGHPAVREGDDATFGATWKSPEELAAFYRGARVLVMPSLWPETFGIVAAEAMSHGVPVVASRIGALPETVVDGETGLLARPGDAADLADRIARVWNDPALARRLGANGRRRAEEEFSEDVHVARLVGVYEAVARRRG